MKFNIINIFILVGILFSSCTFFKKEVTEEKEAPIAKVYDKYLYPSDISELNSTSLTGTDSVEFVRTYANVWVKNQLILQKAESNLTTADLDIEKLIENYRQSLVIFTYEQKVIEQKLDTIVTELEIETYYENNKNNFELRQNIIKASYLITKVGTVKKAATIKKWLMSEKDEDFRELFMFCEKNAVKYYLDENKWLVFSDVLNIIPIKTYNEESFLRTNKYITFKDDKYEYFIYIKDFVTKASISPLEYEKSNINNIIINKRKKLLLQQIENDLYKTAVTNNSIEIY